MVEHRSRSRQADGLIRVFVNVHAAIESGSQAKLKILVSAVQFRPQPPFRTVGAARSWVAQIGNCQ